MNRLTRLARRTTRRFPRLTMSVVRHPWRAGGITVLAVAAVVWIVIGLITLLGPDFVCGQGMSVNAADTECYGVDLDSGPLAAHEPAKMVALENAVKANNDIRDSHGQPTQDYVSIVLLMNLSPDPRVDTRSYADVYPDIEGMLTAAWRANHTADFGSIPKVKVFLANMGSQYAGWSVAADQIKDNAAANHVTAVTGLGQSLEVTQAAARKIVTRARLPVITGTLTGDSMNFFPNSRTLNNGFFRLAPTNTDTVAAAAAFIARIEPSQARVAIVQDNAAGDDYNQTLGRAADADLPMAHQFPFTSPTQLPGDVPRRQELVQQFSFLDQNVCSVAPKVIYFAGRGADLGAFVQTWTQAGTPCATGPVWIVTGDDGGTAINDPAMRHALDGSHVRVVFTSEASPDEWGPCATAHDLHALEQANYNTFQAAFTGRPDACTHQHVTADDGASPLSFDPADLRSEEAAGAHDAAVLAVTVARRADHDADTGDGGIVVRDPYSQIGIIEETQCLNALPGATGRIQYSQNHADYGNPVHKPVPIVQILPDGSTKTLFLVNSGVGASPSPAC